METKPVTIFPPIIMVQRKMGVSPIFFLQGRPMGLPKHTAASFAAEEKVKMATHK